MYEGREALFGGAASGGKSDSILMAALQYVHVPNYSALILRRDFARLSLANAIMDRAKRWLVNTEAVWSEQRHMFTFPSGATLQFGYIDNPDDRFRYGSAEYQFIGWDELTEFALPKDHNNPYRFLFSRLRRTNNLDVPLRVRAASNPGGEGHEWVKHRFITNPEGRLFIRAGVRDNPHVDQENYLRSLAQLDPITRAQLMEGDWSNWEGGRYSLAWFRSYEDQGDYHRLMGADGMQLAVYGRSACWRFITIDPAGTSAEAAKEKKGKPPSYTAIGVWDVTPKADIVAVEVERFRLEYPDVLARVIASIQRHKPGFTVIENTSIGTALIPTLTNKGFSIRPINPGTKDKLGRAADSMNRAQQGKVYLPRDVPWRDEFIAELVQWTGHPDETFDMGDAFSYAGIIVSERAALGGGGFKVMSYGGV